MKFTKILALLLAVVMVGAFFAGCGEKPAVVEPTYVDPYAGKDHAEVSGILYQNALSEFTTYYNEAVEAATVSERYALMAIAEAKLLQAGVMLPSTANYGNYGISRIAPHTVTTTLWGNDSDRFHQSLIIKGEPLLSAEIAEMRAKWAEIKGTGTYEAWAKSYLAGKGYELNTERVWLFDSNPTTWDVLNTSEAVDTEALVNIFDGLLEYDIENVQQPALATGYEVSADGLTYTFHIRQGVNWVDSQGTVLEPVTAKSFVAGLHHMMDAQAGLEYLIQGIVKNASEYMAGKITDFSQVGIAAVDDYTLTYTLEAPCSYFITMFGYSCFAPLCESYFLANGGAFGIDAYAEASSADTYTYGINPNKVAYCGPYLVTSYTESNTIVFDVNPTYWNKDNLNITKITWQFTDGSNPTEGYDLMKEEKVPGTRLNVNALQKAKEEGWFDKYQYVTDTDATSFPIFFNLYRVQYGNFNDPTVAVTTLTDNMKVKTNLAMQNKNFRQALTYALDRVKYNAARVGEETAANNLVNSYTPGTFVTLEQDVTVDINGKSTTFKAGTFYGAIMQAQMDADGFKVKVWDAATSSSSSYDGWYNPTEAKASLTKAIEELKADGMVIDADHPVYLELPYYDINTAFSDAANALKQSIESALDGLVQIVLVKTGGSNRANWNNATYNPKSGDLMNYTISTNSGWGPDYGDPATYLDTMLPDGAGYMTKCLGLY